MQYIKVLATDSTNSALKRRLKQDRKMSNTCLSVERQTKGRGQRGGHWATQPGKNLTFSILLKDLNLLSRSGFILSALVSLGLIAVLKQKIKNRSLRIKWPNDILAGNHKLGGILIENILKGHQINHSIIGIGINVNQTDFPNLPRATSLQKITGKRYDLNHLTVELTQAVDKKVYEGLKRPQSEIFTAYETHLFRKNQISSFELPDGRRQEGEIKGLSPSGRLRVRIDGSLQNFGLKEIKLIY